MKKKWLLIAMCILGAASTMVVSAEGSQDGIMSRGKIYFNNKTENDRKDDVIFDAEDIHNIADRIDVLIEVCR